MVSSPSCEDFRSLHSILASEKLNKLKNQKDFLFCQRSEVTGQSAGPNIGETDGHKGRMTIY